MPIYVERKKYNKIQNKNKESKNIIIVPKKFIKRAVDRNKIRRRIRAILHQKNISGCIIKYFCNEMQSYNIIASTINSKVEYLTHKSRTS